MDTNSKSLPVCILVTTCNRSGLLKNRSILSITNQWLLPDQVVLVDDSVDEFWEQNQKFTAEILQPSLPWKYLKNTRTKGYAGALNTGLKFLQSQFEDCWVAILDDDDEWLEDHLQTCLEHCDVETHAVISGLATVLNGKSLDSKPIPELKIEDFLAGNPGWEGSNTFVRLSSLLWVGGFIETLPNTHDRDLAIRLLSLPDFQYSCTGKITARHYLEFNREQLTTSPRKPEGLLQFWNRHAWRMSPEIKTGFLQRASKLFSITRVNFETTPLAKEGRCVLGSFLFNADQALQEEVVIVVGVRDAAGTIRECLSSILNQVGQKIFTTLIVDDGSTDSWREEVQDYLRHPSVVLVECEIGNTARARNHQIELVKAIFPNLKWIARCDSDDQLATPTALNDCISSAVSINADAKWILAGNLLRQNGKKLARINLPEQELMTAEGLSRRLELMSKGIPEGELPSCNLIFTPSLNLTYPQFDSAEDHWLVAYLLANHRESGVLCTDQPFASYSLDGSVTKANRDSQKYIASRKLLLESAKHWLGSSVTENTRAVLGWGKEGAVFLEQGEVRKEFYPGVLRDAHVEWLKTMPTGPHFPQAKWTRQENSWIAKYPWAKVQKIDCVTRTQISKFLRFCMNKNIVYLNAARQNLGILQDEIFCFDIGRDIRPSTISYFRDMCARIFCLFRLGWSDEMLSEHTERFRDNEEQLKSLPGFEEFYREELERAFSRNNYRNQIPLQESIHPLNKPVTLLIKCCAMDADTIQFQLGHILGQLCSTYNFAEVLVLLDSKKSDFLRQHHTGDFEVVRRILDRHVKSGDISRVLISPEDPDQIRMTNLRWFDLDCDDSHTVSNVPLFSQVWAFDQVRTRYVLQLDIDALICRRDDTHDFLDEILNALGAPDVLSVGFNIAHSPDSKPIPYSAEPGEFVPEVRFGLLDLERIQTHLPLPNQMVGNKPELSWYRSLEKLQQAKELRSLRGGYPRTFYIHPPNPYKRDQRFHQKVIDLVEQGLVPEIQYDRWDLTGTHGDWEYPSRQEEIVVVITGRNIAKEKIVRCLGSLFQQSYDGWGAVIVDDSSGAQTQSWLCRFTNAHREKITLINNKKPQGKSKNQFKYIRKYCRNPESLIVILDMDDAFFHNGVLERLHGFYKQGYEVILGGMYRPDKPLRRYQVRFEDLDKPDGGNVWIHLRSFRKKLFEQIRKEDLQTNGQWLEHCNDYAAMIPIVKSSKKSVMIEEYLYYHERTTENTTEIRKEKDSAIRQIIDRARDLEKPSPTRRTRYQVNSLKVEIDLTYACNLRCTGCNRSCTQSPENLHLPVSAIERFIDDTKKRGIYWESVHLLGGEPTLHPQFGEIITLFDNWFCHNSPATELKVISNGHGPGVKKILSEIPPHWIHEKSYKDSPEIPWFESFNQAPIDLPEFVNDPFDKGCWILEQCGIGLTPMGWFPCAVAGGIERVFQLGGGTETLPENPDDLKQVLPQYCRYCGHYKEERYRVRDQRQTENQDPGKVSLSWKNAYAKYSEEDS